MVVSTARKRNAHKRACEKNTLFCKHHIILRSGQAWSMDLVIGVIIFMLAAGIIFTLLVNREQEDTAPLRIESEVIATKLTTDPILQIAPNNQLDAEKLSLLAEREYESLRKDLGVNNEFCIFIQDESGQLLYVLDGDGNKYTGIGSGNGELNLSGTPCGQQVS